MPYWEAADMVVENVERFARQIRDDEVEFERVLATVLFTDIVDSTKQSAALGDRAWTEARAEHDQIVRANLSRLRGHEIKTMGDGFLATFDGPTRGEIAFEGDDVTGLGVAIGARVAALAGASEVLVSQTVKDLVAGSGLSFEDAREHELKGVPDRWRLYRVSS
jgi:class 3 adenylate cyclase